MAEQVRCEGDQAGVRARGDDAMEGPAQEEEPEEARRVTPARDPGTPTKAE